MRLYTNKSKVTVWLQQILNITTIKPINNINSAVPAKQVVKSQTHLAVYQVSSYQLFREYCSTSIIKSVHLSQRHFAPWAPAPRPFHRPVVDADGSHMG